MKSVCVCERARKRERESQQGREKIENPDTQFDIYSLEELRLFLFLYITLEKHQQIY